MQTHSEMKIKTVRLSPLETKDKKHHWILDVSSEDPIAVPAIVGILLSNANHYYKSLMGLRTTHDEEAPIDSEQNGKAREEQTPSVGRESPIGIPTPT